MSPLPPTDGPNRRTFIVGALAAAGVALLDPPKLAAARQRAALLPIGDLFPLGVASGDPTSSSVILWTRLISPDPGTPLPASDIAVDWEVARDLLFTDVVASGTAPAVAQLAHSVHVDVTGLDPDTVHHYRFTADGRTSAIGRTKTFPGAGANPTEVRFGLASCQNWSDGYYTAHAALALEDLDFVAFVGDYIYERPKSSGARPITLAESVDLPTYRARYELYKSDVNLQAAHHAFAWILTPDDHEIANDVVGNYGKEGADAGDPAAIAAFRERRADAYQAYFEHQPLRLSAPDSPDWVIHRSLVHSDLLRLFVLDGRQYRSPYPGGKSAGTDLPERHAESQTMLGADQEAWLDGQFAATEARWNVIAQQTVMTATPLVAGGTTLYNFDQWDGYVAARNRLLQGLVANEVRNPIVLTGDIHLAGAAGVRLDYEDPDAPDIANELVCTSISSKFDAGLIDLFETGIQGATWIRYGEPRYRGYCVCTVTAETFTTDFRVVETTQAPVSTVRTDFTDVVADRDPIVGPEEPPPTTTTTSTTPPGTTTPTAPGAAPVGGAATYTG